jgi:hypothetical protein
MPSTTMGPPDASEPLGRNTVDGSELAGRIEFPQQLAGA